MSAVESQRGPLVQYEPNETPPLRVASFLAFQYLTIAIAGVVLTVAIVARASGQSPDYLSWASFAALMVSGVCTAVQARRVWRIGAGYVLLMGTSGAFIAASVAALSEGGPGLLASLIIASSLFQFALAGQLAALRRVITPVVAGTVIMLIAVTIMPLLYPLLAQVPDGASPLSAPWTAAATFLPIMIVVLRARGMWRLWGSMIGIVCGCAVAVGFGTYNFGLIADAPWFGLPQGRPPAINELNFGAAFWALLPTFIIVTLVGAIETVGDAVAIQRVSWRKPRATDFGAVQGAVYADGLGNLLSGLLGTVPNTTYSSSISMAEITGVTARRVGVVLGIMFCVVALFPKIAAAVLAIPDPVIATYGFVLISILFVIGARIVLQDGLDYRKAGVVGVAFWAGSAFQEGALFNEYLPAGAAPLFDNGMTAGGLVAIAATLVMQLSLKRPMRAHTMLHADALPDIRHFLDRFSTRRKWPMEMSDRLLQAAEETLILLMDQVETADDDEPRQLRVLARHWEDGAELEFVATAGDGNIEDQIAVLSSHGTGESMQSEMSLRILRHLATSVRHQKYVKADIVSLRIAGPAPAS